MNKSINTIEGIESALVDLSAAVRVYMKSHGIDFTIEKHMHVKRKSSVWEIVSPERNVSLSEKLTKIMETLSR